MQTSTRSLEVPGSREEWPASGTMCSAISGQTFFNAYAVVAYCGGKSIRSTKPGPMLDTHRAYNVVSALNHNTGNVATAKARETRR